MNKLAGCRLGRKSWAVVHQQWLRGLRLEHPADQPILDAYCIALDQARERVRMVELALQDWASIEPYATPVSWLRCFHGIDTVTAMTLVSELHDFRPFRRPRELMSYLGLIPSEHSSGGHTQRGGITKTGNGHARRVLIECAWHYRHQARVSRALHRRRSTSTRCTWQSRGRRREDQARGGMLQSLYPMSSMPGCARR